MKNLRVLVMMLMLSPSLVKAAEFATGPLIKNYGPNASVKQTQAVNKNQKFKIAFDVADLGDEKKVNRKFESLARFLNMHVAAGFSADNIELALVVHGKAGFGLIKDNYYQKEFAIENPNKGLLSELMKNRVKVILCGQSAAYYKISNEQLVDGVEMALSAMTAHAVLQQKGYTLNPF